MNFSRDAGTDFSKVASPPPRPEPGQSWLLPVLHFWAAENDSKVRKKRKETDEGCGYSHTGQRLYPYSLWRTALHLISLAR